jgi:hypothetical protein
MLPDGVTPIVLSGNPVEINQRYGVAARDRMKMRFKCFQNARTPQTPSICSGSFNPRRYKHCNAFIMAV